jgi:peptidoglycan/xylan/chitin deacetylase (PgdA/CDA1 family)
VASARFRILLAATLALVLAVAGCADDRAGEPPVAAAAATAAVRNPAPPVTLTAEDRAVWRTPRRTPGRIPVLLYHGVADRSEFANQADAYYALEPADFAKQMALLHHAGYQAITLERFRAFHAGRAVDLPAHPILITFDDARADAFRNADSVLERYGWSATMFVDVGAVTNEAPEYSTWEQLAAMQRSGRWSIQLHSGRGHHNIRYGAAEREVGPFYAYRDAANGETLGDWHTRVTEDLAWGERELRRHVPGYKPLAFAPPFGAYGQIGTNDPRIPRLMEKELEERFGLVFVQQDPHPAKPGELPVTRLQLDRTTTGGALHSWLDSV